MTIEIKNVERFMRVGETVVLHLEPTAKEGRRCRSSIRGWLKDCYVILDKPTTEKGTMFSLERDRICVVRFVSQGQACGFDTTVLGSGGTIQPIFFISWPKHIEHISVRKHDRMDVRIPCSMMSQSGITSAGEIQDLSSAGCKILAREEAPVGAHFRVSFLLPDQVSQCNLSFTVRKVEPAPNGVFLGCLFDDTCAETREDIAFFVTATLDKNTSKEAEPLYVLMVDDQPSNFNFLQTALHERGYSIVAVSGAADAFFRMRARCPAAVLINQNQRHLPGLDMCRIIKTTRGMESLPLFLYGMEDTGIGKKASILGVEGYFPEIALSTEKLADLLAAYVLSI